MNTNTRRTHRIVLPFTLLSVAFLLGCQEQGSEVAGPQLKKVKPPPASTNTVTLALAMQGGPQSGLGSGTDNSTLLSISGPDVVTTHLTESYAQFEQGHCLVDPPNADANAVAALARHLVQGSGQALPVRVDKTALNEPSVEHRISILVEAGGVRYMQLGTSELFPGLSPVVTNYVDDGTTITFTMGGGVALVKSEGKRKDAIKIVCPNPKDVGDVVDVTVVRQ